MNWRLDFSNQAVKFMEQNGLEDDFIVDKVKLSLRKFRGENVNIDIRKLAGEWKWFYRIRSGKLRIVLEFDFEQCIASIEAIYKRGNVYR